MHHEFVTAGVPTNKELVSADWRANSRDAQQQRALRIRALSADCDVELVSAAVQSWFLSNAERAELLNRRPSSFVELAAFSITGFLWRFGSAARAWAEDELDAGIDNEALRTIVNMRPPDWDDLEGEHLGLVDTALRRLNIQLPSVDEVLSHFATQTARAVLASALEPAVAIDRLNEIGAVIQSCGIRSFSPSLVDLAQRFRALSFGMVPGTYEPIADDRAFNGVIREVCSTWLAQQPTT